MGESATSTRNGWQLLPIGHKGALVQADRLSGDMVCLWCVSQASFRNLQGQAPRGARSLHRKGDPLAALHITPLAAYPLRATAVTF